jgi:hypothetical protein
VRRPITFLVSALFALGLLLTTSLGAPAPASAATKVAATTTCSNGVDNSGGLGLICQVTIINTITKNGGSSKTTVRECHGAAGDPQASCKTTHWNMNRLVTRVNQCNDSINGGGGTLRCSVRITNNFIGVAPGSSTATKNQCVGSGGGITTGCHPFPANTTGATITQCNGSANGGTLVGLKCTASGSKSSSRSVRINQCNGSANGGGALVICSANISNHVLAASTPTSTPTSNSGSTPGTTGGLPPTDTASVPAGRSGGTPLASLLALIVLASVTMVATARRVGRRRDIDGTTKASTGSPA